MSKYYDEEMECPYCHEEVMADEFEAWGSLSDRTAECESCGNKFIYKTEIKIDYTPRRADCLNGLDHDWESVTGLVTPYDFLRCKDCGLLKRK